MLHHLYIHAIDGLGLDCMEATKVRLPSERYRFTLQLAKRISPSMQIGPLSAPSMLVPVMAMAQVGFFNNIMTMKRTAVWPTFVGDCHAAVHDGVLVQYGAAD